jgi:ABC-type glycerol-3-phosphate transport system substrate-binding protein
MKEIVSMRTQRNMRKRTRVAASIAVAGLVASLTACSSSSATGKAATGKAATGSATGSAATGSAATGSAGSSAPTTAKSTGVTLTFWHYFTDRAPLFQKLAQEYQQQTGVKVNMELISSGDTLGQKFQAAAQAHTLPDITAAWAGIGDKLAPYAKQGLIADLSPAMQSDGWSKDFSDAELQAASFPAGNSYGIPSGVYLVPIDSNNMQFLYNKDLFAKAGITELPTTMDQFLADGKKLAGIGVAPFVAGLGSWPVDSLAQVYEWNIIGQSDLESTFAGKMPYTSAPWVKFLSFFKTLADAHVLAQGVLADDDPAAESLFVSGQAGMIFDGSWAIGVFNQQNPDFKNYGVFFPPTAGSFPAKIPGGVGAEAFVVGTSPHKAEAVKFMEWLTAAAQQADYANTSFNLPANVTVAQQQSLSGNIKTFSDKMDSLIPALATSMSSAVDTTMDKGIQQVIAGKESPEQVAAAMQKAEQTNQAQ